MTKEELHNRLRTVAVDSMPSSIQHTLDEFFSQNVVIPRGENRHPYADVLHEWIEGEPCQWLDESQGEFVDLLLVNRYHINQYRIKPKGPVYEYYYVRSSFVANEKSASPCGYLTEAEANNKSSIEGVEFYQVPQTKRVRQ